MKAATFLLWAPFAVLIAIAGALIYYLTRPAVAVQMSKSTNGSTAGLGAAAGGCTPDKLKAGFEQAIAAGQEGAEQGSQAGPKGAAAGAAIGAGSQIIGIFSGPCGAKIEAKLRDALKSTDARIRKGAMGALRATDRSGRLAADIATAGPQRRAAGKAVRATTSNAKKVFGF